MFSTADRTECLLQRTFVMVGAAALLFLVGAGCRNETPIENETPVEIDRLTSRESWPFHNVRLGQETREALELEAGARYQAEVILARESIMEFAWGRDFGQECELLMEISIAVGSEPARPIARLSSRDIPDGTWVGERVVVELGASGPAVLVVQAHIDTGGLKVQENTNASFRSGGDTDREAREEGVGCGGLKLASPILFASGQIDPRPDIVLISIDTLRADRLGSYGYPRETSPVLDRLAAEGMRFDDVTSHSPWTTPSHMSLFTSLYPAEHGVNHRMGAGGAALIEGGVAGMRTLRPGVKTLADLMRDAGYRTEAFSSGGPIGARLGFAQGFESFADFLRPLDRKIDLVIERLSSWRDRPTFVFLHTFEVHMPYRHTTFAEPYLPKGVASAIRGVPPSIEGYAKFFDILHANEIYNAGTTSDLYDGGILYVDQQLARLLAALERRARPTIVVVTSDHGEAFAEHDETQFVGVHGASLYQEQIHIPLIIWGVPGVEPGTVVKEPVPQVDIAPTILELAGLSTPSSMTGISLVAAMRGEASPPERTIISEALNLGNERIAVRVADHKLVMKLTGEDQQLFRLDTDPRELRDLRSDDANSRLLEEEAIRHFVRSRPGFYFFSWGRGCYEIKGTIRTSSPIAVIDPTDLLGNEISVLSPREMRIHFKQSPQAARILAFRCEDAEQCGLEVEFYRDMKLLAREDYRLGTLGSPRSQSVPLAALDAEPEALSSWLRDGSAVHISRVAGIAPERKVLDEPLDPGLRAQLEALGYMNPVGAETRPNAPKRLREADAHPRSRVFSGRVVFQLADTAVDLAASSRIRNGVSWCGDFDGDRQLDRVSVDWTLGEPLVEWAIDGGAETVSSEYWKGDPLLRGPLRSWDMNADGKADILAKATPGQSGCGWYMFGGSRFHRMPCDRASSQYVYDGDFDGDGRVDRLIVDQRQLDYRVALAKDEIEKSWYQGLGWAPGLIVRDRNGDGLDDVEVSSSGAEWCFVLESHGDSFLKHSCVQE